MRSAPAARAAPARDCSVPRSGGESQLMVSPSGAMTGAAQSPSLEASDIRDVMKGRTLGLARVGSVLVLAHNVQAPAAEEWTRYCQAIATHHAVLTGQLVLAEGAGPDAAQRQQVLDGVIQHYPKGAP